MQGVETFSPVVKESQAYKNAQKRANDYKLYSSYDTKQFSSALKNGDILP